MLFCSDFFKFLSHRFTSSSAPFSSTPWPYSYVKVKKLSLSLHMPWRHTGGVVLHGGEQSALCPRYFTPGEGVPGTPW